MQTRRGRSGFALADGVALILSATILLLLGIACLDQTRRHAGLDEDLGSLRGLAAATDAYAADNANVVWAFSWEKGGTYEMLGIDGEVELVTPESPIEASSLQAVHLIRRLGNRIGEDGMPIVNNWIPQVYYSHLPLQDYLGSRIPQRFVVSTADENRLNWQDDPVNKFDSGFWLPLQPSPSPSARRWPYSASFQQTSAAWDRYQSLFGERIEASRTRQGGYNGYGVPETAALGPSDLSGVAYPSGKVHVFDTHQRHFGDRAAFFGLAEARIPLLFFDGAAAVRQTGEGDPGWQPQNESAPCTVFNYEPRAWEPATTNGEDSELVKGYYRWTRGGLKGRDFGGRPLDTGQIADCPP